MSEDQISTLLNGRWTDEDTVRAERIWATYQQENDVSDRVGQAAGIDPNSGSVWIGEDAVDVAHQRDAAGYFAPLYLIRVGSDYFERKGRR